MNTDAIAIHNRDRNPEALQEWVKHGSFQKIDGRDIFVIATGEAPVAGEAMADRIKLWSPTTDVYKIASAGHWPSIETLDVIADAILSRLPLYDK